MPLPIIDNEKEMVTMTRDIVEFIKEAEGIDAIFRREYIIDKTKILNTPRRLHVEYALRMYT